VPFFRSCFIAPFFRRYGFYDVLRNPLPGLRFPDGCAGSRDKRGEREKEETLHPRNYGRFYYVSLLVRTRGIREVPIQFGNIFADLLSSFAVPFACLRKIQYILLPVDQMVFYSVSCKHRSISPQSRHESRYRILSPRKLQKLFRSALISYSRLIL